MYLSNFHILLVYSFFLFPHLFVFSPLPVRECGNELWSGGRVQWGQRVASRPAIDSWVEMLTGLSPLCTFDFYGLLRLERQTSTVWNDRMVELWSHLRTQWEQKGRIRVLCIEVAKIWVPFYELKECNPFGFWIFYLVLIRWKILTQHFSGSHHKAKHIFKVLLWDFLF